MSRNFTASVTLAALLAAFAAPGFAQPSPETAPPPAAAAAEPVALPQLLRDAGLTDVSSKRGPHGGTRIEGKLPDGSKIDAMLDDQGKLRGLRSRGDAALPKALTDPLVPQAVRDNAVMGEFGDLHAVFVGDRGAMLAGRDGDKNKLRAAFSEDGTLLRFGRGDHDGPRPGMRPDRKADKKYHDRQDKKRNEHHRKGDKTHDRKHDQRPRDGRGGDMTPPPGADAAQRQGALAPAQTDPAQLDRGEVRMALAAAGYSRIGEIMQDGPRVMAQAVNPEGEQVAVELTPQGKVMREINR